MRKPSNCCSANLPRIPAGSQLVQSALTFRHSCSWLSTTIAEMIRLTCRKPSNGSIAAKPAFGHLRVTEFTTKALNDYIRERQHLGRKNATINRELAHLRRAFRLGFEHDPQLVSRLPVIKALREDNVRDGFLEPEHYRLILEALTDEIKPSSWLLITWACERENCWR